MKKLLLNLTLLLPVLVFSQTNDLSLDSAIHRMGVGGHYETGLDYFIVPGSQISPMEFSGQVSNQGTSDLTNCQLFVEVSIEGAQVFLDSSATIDLTSGESDSLELGSPYTPSSGTNKIKFWIGCDGIDDLSSNDTIEFDVEIGDGTSANKYRRASMNQMDAINSFPGSEEELFEIGNTFEIFDDMCFGAVNLFIPDSNQNVGQSVYCNTYLLDTLSDSWTIIAAGYEIDISSSELGSYSTFLFDDCIEFEEGDVVLVTVGHYGGSIPPYFGLAQKSPAGSVIRVADGEFYEVDSPRSIMYSLTLDVFDGYLDLDSKPEADMNSNSLANFPNPFTSTTTISYRLSRPQSTRLIITDLQGKNLINKDLGRQIAGFHSFQLSTDDWTEGVYLYTLKTGNEIHTKKMVLIR